MADPRSLLDDERVSGCDLWNLIETWSAFSCPLDAETLTGSDSMTSAWTTSAPGDDDSLDLSGHPSDLDDSLSCSLDDQYDTPAHLPDGGASGCWLPCSGVQTI